ncbi:MAG TPA: hypothetical protein VLD58_09835, partial [Gemmatimonadales bacterium]|nr:hypothetical protein [Gemmatimonadales bacterium]
IPGHPGHAAGRGTMSAFLRAIGVKRTTPLVMPASLQSWSQSGKAQTRASLALGRSWTEVYQTFKSTDADGRAFIQWLNQIRRSGETFTISHYLHLTHTGGGSGAARVNGANQTGSTLNVENWSGTDPVMKAGDLLLIAGLSAVRHLTVDAPNLAAGACAFTIDPPILAGQSPSDHAALTYTAVPLTAILVDLQMPSAGPDEYLMDVQASFREALA